MEKKFTEFSLDEATRLAKTPTGQQLMHLLKQHPDAKEAATHAGAGDMDRAKQTLSTLMADPQAQALLRQLWEEYHG